MNSLAYKSTSTPMGKIYLAASDRAIVALTWDKADLEALGISHAKENAAHPLLIKAEKQLHEYFAGKRKSFALSIDFSGTDFQKKVWKTLEKIPYGETWSYQELAKQIGSSSAMRAVGNANGKNPICIFIPCHRVIRSNGEIGGYTGGQEKKIFLLNLESHPKSRSA